MVTRLPAPDRPPMWRADNDRDAGASTPVRPSRPLRPAPAAAKQMQAEGDHA